MSLPQPLSFSRVRNSGDEKWMMPRRVPQAGLTHSRGESWRSAGAGGGNCSAARVESASPRVRPRAKIGHRSESGHGINQMLCRPPWEKGSRRGSQPRSRPFTRAAFDSDQGRPSEEAKAREQRQSDAVPQFPAELEDRDGASTPRARESIGSKLLESREGDEAAALPCDHSPTSLDLPVLQSADVAQQMLTSSRGSDKAGAEGAQEGEAWAEKKGGGTGDSNEEARLELSPETVAIALVYFVQGILGLSRLAVTFFLKDDFGLDPAEVAILTGAATFPWLIKPLYGFISDAVPLFGYRRRSYLVGSGLVGALAWLLMATAVSDKYSAVAMIVMSSLGAAVSDVVVDSMVVARARGEAQSLSGSLQSLCWGSAAAGSLLSAYFSGALVEQWGPRAVFGLTALLPLITTGVGFYVPENRVIRGAQGSASTQLCSPASLAQGSGNGASSASPSSTEQSTFGGPSDAYSDSLLADRGRQRNADGRTALSSKGRKGSASGGLEEIKGSAPEGLEGSMGSSGGILSSLKEQLVQLRGVFAIPQILLPTIFIFCWQATPHSETAMFFYTTNVLGFGPEFLGRVRLVTAFASLGGVLLFNFYLRSMPLRPVFFWSNIIGTVLGSSPLILVYGLNRSLGISDQFFLLGDSLVLAVLGQISFMPVLVLAAKVCPPGIEATLFASLMSISNGAGVVGGLLGAGLTQWLHVTGTDFDNLALLLIICNCSSLLALPLLRLLPDDKESLAEAKKSL